MNAVTSDTNLDHHPVVSADEWIAERKKLLAREKELTRLNDETAALRRALPWVRMSKQYLFDTLDGPRTLAELFAGRSQLMVQHFMLGPGWQQGCPSCSFMADHTDGMTLHLAARDVTFVAVSRAPLAEIMQFRQRMGWRFNWASSHSNEFNYDMHVSFRPEHRIDGEVFYNFAMTPFPSDEAPGLSLFYRNDGGEVFHTYSTFGRGAEVMMGTYPMLDLAPRGRAERDVPYKMEWVRHHDRYENVPAAGDCCAGKT